MHLRFGSDGQIRIRFPGLPIDPLFDLYDYSDASSQPIHLSPLFPGNTLILASDTITQPIWLLTHSDPFLDKEFKLVVEEDGHLMICFRLDANEND